MSKSPSGSPRALLAFCRERGVAPRAGLDADEPDTHDGTDFERYEVLHELGRGAFGRVVLAVDRDLGRRVALKLLDADEAAPEDIQAFLDEAVITAGLEHPNIVPAHELGYSSTLGLYYSMKPLPGRSLRERIEAARQGDEEGFGRFRRLGLFSDVCRAVAYAHDRGVIHTDLKPENVLLGARGEVVVADWGEAQMLGASRTRDRVTGTPGYMSPEQATGSALDVRTDVWSLGVLLFELLTLEPPFDGPTEDAILDRVLNEAPAALDADEGLAALCAGALQKRAAKRTPHVQTLLDGVDAYLDGAREGRCRKRRATSAARAAAPFIEQANLLLGDTPSARQARFETYRRALNDLRPGLDVKDADPEVGRLAGEIYWGVFRWVHPATKPATPTLASDALELLTELGTAAPVEVVRVGRDLVGNDWDGDPWLGIVRALGTSPDSPIRQLAQRVAVLGGTELFSGLTASELLPIADACTSRHLAPGETLFSEGDVGTALFVVEAGDVEIMLSGHTIQTLGPGAVLGEISVLSEERRTAGARAQGATTVLSLEADRFRSIVAVNGEVGLCVIDVLTERLRVAAKREADLRRQLGQDGG